MIDPSCGFQIFFALGLHMLLTLVNGILRVYISTPIPFLRFLDQHDFHVVAPHQVKKAIQTHREQSLFA